jgi:hypothetical protein
MFELEPIALPDEPAAIDLRARALRQLGRTAEAEAEARRYTAAVAQRSDLRVRQAGEQR